MLYYLFRYLDKAYHLPGAALWEYISFRTGMAIIFSLIITLLLGKRIINRLQKLQIGEIIRDLGLEGQIQKQGTPTMGGLIILAGVTIPVLLVARLANVYVWLALLAMLSLGLIGFLDDYIKVFKKNKAGLAGKLKVIGQVAIGIFVGAVLYWHPGVVIKQHGPHSYHAEEIRQGTSAVIKSTTTTIPFFKNNELDYADALRWLGNGFADWSWLIYITVVVFIVTAVSNGANITDGLDGLASGVSAIIVVVLGLFAYLSGNSQFADYLNIMYIPYLGEVVIFTGALFGACVGFLWWNAYPAQVFMGDTGSLSLGGTIAVLALMVRKELLIPILCGVFVIENLSVLLQVGYFKYTRKKYGEGRRLLKMAPLHHHYQKLHFHESKIVARFWIVTVFLGILTIITLKIR